MREQNKSTRIRWTSEERQKFIEHGAKLLNEKPSWKDVDIIRQAMNALVPERRRDVLSVQPFAKELTTMKELAARLTAEAQSPSKPPQDKLLKSELSSASAHPEGALERSITIAVRYFIQAIKEELQSSISPLEVAQEISRIPEIQTSLNEIVKKQERLDRSISALCSAWGVDVAQDQSAATVQEKSVVRDTAKPDARSEPQKRVAKLRLTVVGVKGRQIESLRSLVKDDPVEITCVQAGSSKALHSNAGKILVWTSMVGHRDTNSNPNAVKVAGGFSRLKAAVTQEVAAWKQAQS